MKNVIPIKIDVVQKREGLFSANKTLSILGFSAIVLSCIIFGLYKIATVEEISYKVAWAFITLLATYLSIRLLMRFGLNEKEMYKRYLLEKENKEFKIRDLWDILSIEDTGKIIYKNGKSAYLIKMDRTSIIGKPEDFVEINYTAMTQIIKQLMNKDYIVRKYKLLVSDANVEKFKWVESRVARLKNAKLKKMAEDIIRYNKEQTVGKNNRSIEYWLVYARIMNKHDLTEINEILKGCSRTIYKPCVENMNGVYDFLYKFYKLDHLDIKDALYSNLSPSRVAMVDMDTLVPVDIVDESIFEPIGTKEDILAHKYAQKMKRLNKDE